MVLQRLIHFEGLLQCSDALYLNYAPSNYPSLHEQRACMSMVSQGWTMVSNTSGMECVLHLPVRIGLGSNHIVAMEEIC